MKQVTFNRAMAPFGMGDRRLVPDDVAARLQSEGAVDNVVDFPEKPEAEQKPESARDRRARARRAAELPLPQNYATK